MYVPVGGGVSKDVLVVDRVHPSAGGHPDTTGKEREGAGFEFRWIRIDLSGEDPRSSQNQVSKKALSSDWSSGGLIGVTRNGAESTSRHTGDTKVHWSKLSRNSEWKFTRTC